jgi:hypothetical protein
MKPVITLNSYLATSHFGKKADFLEAADIRRLLAEGTKLPYTDEGSSTNWLDEITRNAMTQCYNVNMTGGRENSAYSA